MELQSFKNDYDALINDFEIFMEYIIKNNVKLTKTNNYINMKSLFEINKLMTQPQEGVTERSQQPYYPMLHMFYYISLFGKLLEVREEKAGSFFLEPTEQLRLFNEMNPAEKYITLLEILWVDCDFEKMDLGQIMRMNFMAVEKLLERVHEEKGNVEIDLMYSSGCEVIVRCLSYLGFWTVIRDIENEERYGGKKAFFPDSIKVTETGKRLSEILLRDRNLREWNTAVRRSFGEYKANTSEPFNQAFKKLFNPGELEKSLPRDTIKFIDGMYTIKVMMSNKVWRTIELSANHTLLDVHDAIQEAFEFDDDHLYSFFMDGEMWSDYRYNSPMDNEGPYVDEVKLGELGLREKSRFLYLFDFGDEWVFGIEVISIVQCRTIKGVYRIIESKGKSPEQYPGGDW